MITLSYAWVLIIALAAMYACLFSYVLGEKAAVKRVVKAWMLDSARITAAWKASSESIIAAWEKDTKSILAAWKKTLE